MSTASGSLVIHILSLRWYRLGSVHFLAPVVPYILPFMACNLRAPGVNHVYGFRLLTSFNSPYHDRGIANPGIRPPNGFTIPRYAN